MSVPGNLPGDLYPPLKELNENTEALEEYFKEKGWEFSWDFRAKTGDYWYNIYLNDKGVMQIDMDCPPEQVEKDIKECIPEYDGTLESVHKALKGQYLYIEKEKE